MFVNNTGFQFINDFEHAYKDIIYAHYPIISNKEINFVTTEQYLNLDNVPPIENLDYDSFSFSCKRVNDCVTGYVIYSPTICKHLDFSSKELYAALAHEVGHIIHYFNESLIGLPQICQEMKADEVASKLGLTTPLISVLDKLINCEYCSDAQRADMEKRKIFL